MTALNPAIDYSFADPPVSEIVAAGVQLVIRYTTSTKALTWDEAQALRANGRCIAIVHETTIDRPNVSGSAGGIDDMHQVQEFMPHVGYPASGVVFFADDTSPNLNACRNYFQGVRSVAGEQPIGWYGGMQVGLQLLAEGLVDVVWVANATSWSGYHNSSDFPAMRDAAIASGKVHMIQHLDKPFASIPPSEYDYDEVLIPFPVWGNTAEPQPKPRPPKITTTDVGDAPVKRTNYNPVKLDEHGDGNVPAPAHGTVQSIVVRGGREPNTGHAYDQLPTSGLSSDAKVVILEHGVPFGVYSVDVWTV